MSTKLATWGSVGSVVSVIPTSVPPISITLISQVIGPQQYFPPAQNMIPDIAVNSRINLVLTIQDQFGIPVVLTGASSKTILLQNPDTTITNIPAGFLYNGSDGNLTAPIALTEAGYYKVWASCVFGTAILTTTPVVFRACQF